LLAALFAEAVSFDVVVPEVAESKLVACLLLPFARGIDRAIISCMTRTWID